MARYLIIHNPISGAGLAARFVPAIAAELQSRGHHVDSLGPRSKAEAIAAARQVDPACDALISVGGDGTHNTIVNGLVGNAVPMLPVPAGTENVLCRALAIPADPARVREILESGRVRPVDVAFANDHAFLVMSGVGFDASVTREVHQNRRGPIKRCYYYWPSFRNWLGYRWPHLEVEVDGQVVARDAGLAIVGNMRRYADKLFICARALPDDGLLDVCVFTRRGRWNLLSYFLSTKLERHLQRPDVVYRQGRRIVVRPTENGVPYQVDGDAVGLAPVEYTLRPAALRIFVGAEATAWQNKEPRT